MKYEFSRFALVNRRPLPRHTFTAAAILLAALSARAVDAQGSTPNQNHTIVFVCLHGSVKSQMAAAHFNKIASERGLPYTAVSRGLDIDGSIPPRIRDALNAEGLSPTDDAPRGLTATEASGARMVIAFDGVPDKLRGLSDVTYWRDVPPATNDYDAARDVIVGHIDELVPKLASRPPGQE